jgi:hypothetical protein
MPHMIIDEDRRRDIFRNAKNFQRN